MSSKQTRRERRTSTARERAEQHTSGFETTTLRVPEGLKFWNPKEGVYNVDFIPYKVKKGKETPGGNPFARAGVMHYERTYYYYKNLGLEEKNYVSLEKTFKKKDPVAEYIAQAAKDGSVDPESLKQMKAKERQMFLVYVHGEEAEGLRLWEFSYHNFGKLLDSRIKTSDEEDGWDWFYYTDDEGMTLRLTLEKVSGKYTYTDVTAIDFKPRRKPLPKEIIEHGYDLDEMIIETPYDALKRILEGQPAGDTGDESGSEQSETSPEPETQTSPETEVKEPRKRERKKKEEEPKSEESPFKLGAKVVFEGDDCTIVRVSKDGTSFTLEDDQEQIIKAVGADEMRPIVDAAPSKEELDKQADEVFGGGDGKKGEEGSWDEDWND